MKTFDFELSNQVEYQHKGEHLIGTYLELTAPAAKNRKQVAKLKQGFMRAINDLQTDDAPKPKDNKDVEIKPDEVLAIVQMGSIEYDEYMDIFIKLLTEGICKIDGKEDLTAFIAEKISFDDMERLMGEYLVNFIIGLSGK